MNDLVRRLNGLCDEQPYYTGWYLKNLRTGEEADRNGDKVVPSASTRKIAIMMATLKAINEGHFTLKQLVTVQEKYQNNNSGCFQHLWPGMELPLRDMIVMMIIVSDNTCTGTIVDMVGLDYVNEFSHSIGMENTTHRHGIPPTGLPRDHPVEHTNATTPNDVGRLLDLIVKGTEDEAAAKRLGCTTDQCRLALDILSWQKLRQRLPAHLPLGTKVAHKTGTGARNNNDAGIVFQGDDPLFILTVYTDNLPEEMPDGRMSGFAAASYQIATMARECWDALKQ